MELPSQFCSYEIALKLKKLGFNEPCLTYWKSEKQLHTDLSINNWTNNEKKCIIVTAPLWQQAIDHIREKYDIYISPYPIYRGDSISFYKIDFAKNGETFDTEELFGIHDSFDTYEQARAAAIIKALELIKP